MSTVNGLSNPNLEKYYYSGSDTLLTGYALCFDSTASSGASDPKDEIGVRVVKPATAHLNGFAGVVHHSSNNVTGPAWVWVETPQRGQRTVAFTKANMTKFSTGLEPVDGSYALQGATDATLNLQLAAMALETADTSSTAANKVVQWK